MEKGLPFMLINFFFFLVNLKCLSLKSIPTYVPPVLCSIYFSCSVYFQDSTFWHLFLLLSDSLLLYKLQKNVSYFSISK